MILDAIKDFFEKLFGKKEEGGAIMPGPKKPKFMDIDITVEKLNAPDPAWPQGYKFTMDDGKGNPNAKKLDFENDHHPGFIVSFNLVEKKPAQPTKCQFLPDPDDAMWVQKSSLAAPPCPKSATYWDQFRAVDVVDYSESEKNRTLMVYNRNDSVQMFAFTLRFEIPGYPDVVIFDPIGNNQNGDQ